MNWDQIEGEWKQLKGHVKSQWAKFTDDDMQNLSAKKDSLVGKIQERYGVLKDDAERQVDEWIAKIKPQSDTTNANDDPQNGGENPGRPGRKGEDEHGPR